MPILLCIDTSLEQASVCLSEGERILAVRTNDKQADHAAWIHVAVAELVDETGTNFKDLSAVAVTAGPGSYTGLRVGMATAKGICYALNLPLITESTLRLMAQRVLTEVAQKSVYALPVLIGPMVDARRMEVFTTLYDMELQEKVEPGAMILDQNSFSSELEEHIILFCGNGSKKWQNLCMHSNAVFVDVTQNVSDLALSAARKFKKGTFADLAYTEPAYLKNFYTGKNK